MKIYIAASLFSEAERFYNSDLAGDLMDQEHEVFLPQDECEGLTKPKDIFETCLRGLTWCDIVIAVLDGADIDSGTAWECGRVYGQKEVYGLRTDFRKASDDPRTGLNIMLAQGVTVLFTSREHLLSCTKRWANDGTVG